MCYGNISYVMQYEADDTYTADRLRPFPLMLSDP